MSNVASFFLQLFVGPLPQSEAEKKSAKVILGEATDKLYKQQIEVSSFGWELARTSASSRPTGSGAPQRSTSSEPSILKFSKQMCRATSGMLSAMENGELLSAVFSLEEDSATDFKLELTLERVRILDYSVELEGTEIKENWQFNYESIRFDYKPDYKSASLTVSLTRYAGASTEAPADNSSGGKIRSLAEGMSPEALRPLLKSLESDLSKRGTTSPVASKTTGVTK
jgi:type VI protein secretion system component Hcp